MLHRAAYEALGLTGWEYDRHRVGGGGDPDVASFVSDLGPEWVGLSVTMPCKEAALAVAGAATEQAQRIGAANTLVRRHDGWVASNTDPDGVTGALLDAGVTTARSAVVLGAGATARATIDALARMRVRDVTFVVRAALRPETEALTRRLGMSPTLVRLEDRPRVVTAMTAAPVVVSTLPAGAPLGSVAGFDRADLTGTVVLDAVYADWPTPLARWAGECGATVVPGTEMLLHQAAVQVELMTGRTAPVEAMRAALHAALDTSNDDTVDAARPPVPGR